MTTTNGYVFYLRNSSSVSTSGGVNKDALGYTGSALSSGTENGSTVLASGAPYFVNYSAYSSLAIDPSAQSYFFVDQQGVTLTSAGAVQSYSGRPSIRSASTTSGAINANFIYTGPNYTASGDYGSINDIAVDQANHRLYFTQSYVTGIVDNGTDRVGKPDTANSGLFVMSESGGTATRITAAGTLTSPTVVALDLADNIAFVADVTGVGLDGGTAQYGANNPVNRLTAVNLSTGAVQVLFTYAYHPDQTYGTYYYGGNVLDGLAVDATTHTLYYTVNDLYNPLYSDSFSDTQDGIYKVGFSVSGGSVSLGTTAALYTGTNAFDPSRIKIDTQDGVFYVVGNTVAYDANLGGPGPSGEAIYVGSLTANNVTALTRVTPASESNGAYFGTADQNPYYQDDASFGFDAVPLMAAGNAVNYKAGAGATATSATLTTSSSTSVNYIGGTVSLGGYRSGDVLAATTSGTSIAASFSNGTLTLSGTDTVANYQSVLRSITYRSTAADPTGAGASTSRTLTYTVTDGIASGTTTSTVAEQTAPVVNAGSPSVTFTGGGAAVAVDPALTVVDYTSSNLAGATIGITAGLVSGDTLGFASQNGITGSFDATSGVLTLSGSATVAQYQAAVRSVTFGFTAGGNPTAGNNTSRTLSYTMTDGSLTSSAVTSTLSVVHTPPTVSTGNTVTFTRGNGAVAPSPSATVGTPDSGGTLTGATVSITGGFASGDTLAATGANGITTSYNASTGVLTLSGTATGAQYQAVLDGVTFTTGNAATVGNRTLSTVVNDGTANSATATSTVTVAAPTPSIGGTAANQAVNDNATVSPFSGITITDAPNETETATLTVKAGGTASDANGTLSGSGLTKTGLGTYTVNAQAPSTLMSLLRGLVFTPTANEVPPGSTVTTGFSVAIADAGGGSANDVTTTVVATSVADAPTITGTSAGQTTTDLAPVQPFSSVTIGDVDAGATPTVTITLRSGGAATDANGVLSGSGLSRTGAGTYTLAAASPATLTSEIRALAFTPTQDQVPIGQSVTTELDILAASYGTSTTNTATTVQATEVACYCRGTLILTDRGEVAVEDLVIDDQLVTVSGELRRLRWIGTRSYTGRFLAARRNLLPVLFRAGSLGGGMPRRDLLVSPKHAMYLDGVLIPALALVNGGSVVQLTTAEQVDYYHLELDTHDVIWAEGAASETFLDDDSRGMFHNAAEFHALYPDASDRFERYCAPRVEDGPLLEAARDAIAARGRMKAAS